MSGIHQFQTRIWGAQNTLLGCGWLAPGGAVVTCFHVIKKHQNDLWFDFPLLDQKRRRAHLKQFYPEKERPAVGDIEDIAILMPDPDEPMPHGARPAPLSDPGESFKDLYDRPISVIGFPQGMDDGDYIDGVLKGLTAKGWVQFDHDLTSRLVAEGFSGTAVWDKINQCAVGMVVAKQTRDNMTSGYMIPMAVLARAWPPLLPAKADQGGSRPSVGPLVHKMCNREKQDAGFRRFFQNTVQACAKSPQIYIIHGEEGDCHESLVARLRYVRIKEFFKGAALHHYVPFGFDGDFNQRRHQLECQLADTFGDPCSAPIATVEDLCRLPVISGGKHPVVVLSHHLFAARWDRHYERLIQWYVNEFWAMIECREDIPQFLIFFMVIYPSAEQQTIFDKVLGKTERSKKKIITHLAQMIATAKAPCRGFLLDELPEIFREDVIQWFSKYFPDHEKEKRDRIEALFAAKKSCCMADVEDVLEKFVHEQVSI